MVVVIRNMFHYYHHYTNISVLYCTVLCGAILYYASLWTVSCYNVLYLSFYIYFCTVLYSVFYTAPHHGELYQCIMLSFDVLCYVFVSFIALYCTVLWFFLLHSTSWWTVWCYTIHCTLCYVALYCIEFYCAALYFTMIFCLCCIVLYLIVLWLFIFYFFFILITIILW